MAHLKPYVIGVSLMTVICAAHSTASSQLNDDHNYNKNNCSLMIIKNTDVKDITLVHVKNNDFLKDIHSLPIKTQMRSFFAPEIHNPNLAYVVQCDDFRECEKGFDDLVKDRYWNPNAIFVVTVRNFSQGSHRQDVFFQKLHHLYVFKTVLVTNDRLYFYDFQISDHCRFTVRAIKDYECDSLSSEQGSVIWAHIKGSLEDKYKTPYSGCNMSVIVHIREPFVFRLLDDKNEPFGYEEEFIRILKRLNFTRIVYSYNINMSSTGVVCENFTVSGILKKVQTGVVDYVVGGTMLSHYRLQVFDFTYPHWCDHFLLVVPKARQTDKWEVMYTVFKPLVWGLILLAFACVSLVTFILQINSKKDLHLFILTALDLYGYFTNSASKKSSTLFMLSWALFTWLITCFYQCNLASIFTKPTYWSEINTLQEVLKQDYKLYLSKGFYNFMKGSEELNMGGLVQNSTLCISEVDCLKAVAYKRKQFTVVSRLAYLYHEAEFHKDGEAMLHQAKAYTHVFMTGYLRKGNPNLKRIRTLERLVIAFGFHHRSLLAYIHMKKLKYNKAKKNLSVPLSCNDIAGVYYIYLCGCGISLITFFIEVVLNKMRLINLNGHFMDTTFAAT